MTPSPPRSALARRVGAALDTGRLPGDVGAVFADLATGEILYERDRDRLLPPASTLKLATAVAAVYRLGPDHRIPTTLVDAGSDTVALLPGGDVTLNRGGTGHYPGAASLRRLARDALAARRGRRPRVLLVDPAATTASIAPGTGPEDLRHATAPMGPIMLDGGRLRRGHDRRRRAPVKAAVRALARDLGVDRVVEGPVEADATELATVWSPPLSALVGRMLDESDNTLADAVAMRLAQAETGERTWPAAGRTLADALAELGVGDGVQSVDGSGLSRGNRCTAAALADLLTAAWTRPSLRPALAGLPVAGLTGTLRDRFERAPEAIGSIRAKTGTLTGVSTLAGIAFGARAVAFAILTSGNHDDRAARAAIDEAAAAALTTQE